MPYQKFLDFISQCAEEFKRIEKNETIRLISHLDCDGLSACSIMIKALNIENRRYTTSIVQQLDKAVLSQLAKEQYNYFVFTDLGSGCLSTISTLLREKNVYVLDHHIPETAKEHRNILHINPHIFGHDGNMEISASGVVYLFACAVNKRLEELAYISIIGATGDMQENNGFIGLNNIILNKAISNDSIEVSRGLRIFGRQTRPLHKILEYTTDPYIPNVTGSESGAIQFLYDLGIEPKNENGWKKLIHLTEEEMQRLVTGIIMRRINEVSPEDVLGNIYTLKNEPPESPLRDIKEFTTLLNACGRLNKPSLGIGACIGDSAIKNSAIQILSDYKRAIVNATKWYENNRNSECVINGDGYIIINARDFVLSTIIGTLASIICKSQYIKNRTYILAMAQQLTGKIKISLRISGKNSHIIDLREIIKEILYGIENAEFGGHENAAGAVIPFDKESIFIERARYVLGKRGIEETIN